MTATLPAARSEYRRLRAAGVSQGPALVLADRAARERNAARMRTARGQAASQASQARGHGASEADPNL